MPDPGGSPGLVDIARRWASRLADPHGGGLPKAEVEHALLSMAEEVASATADPRDAATKRFAALYSALPVGAVITDPTGHVLDVNPAFTRLLGYQRGDLVGRHVADLGAAEKHGQAIRGALDALPAPQPRQRERLELAHAEEGPLRVQLTVAGLPGDTPGSLYPVLIIEDISELALLHETLRKQNVRDALTGLPNTGSFVAQLESTLASAPDSTIALVYFDIDGFKVVNDGLGPGAGDAVLRHVADRLAAVFTKDDAIVARLSGDGFGVLMTGSPTRAKAVDLVEEAMADLAEPKYLDGKGVAVSVSVGIVVLPASGQSPQELHRAAEMTLHRAKEAGRAQWMLYEPDLDSRDRHRYQLGAGIGGALESGEFEVEYAPTVKLDGSNQIAVVNAMLRWNHPEHGQLRPEEFYPVADATGMTLSLGKWLLERSLAEAASWREEVAAPPDICIRLPRRLAIDPNLVGIVRDLLERTGLNPQQLRICTDPFAVHDPRGEVLESISVLSQLDVKVALAVTGAADLELIEEHHLPVGFVILGGPLVEGLAARGPDADAARKHLRTLIHRAAELGIKRVGAEGVRTADQAQRLREAGVIAGRGKLFANATGADEIRDLIRSGAPTAANPAGHPS